MPKRLELTRGLFTLVDDEDAEELNTYRWHATDTHYAKRANHGERGVPPSPEFLHRRLMGVKDPKLEVDHINNNTLDNRKINLRICTRNENAKNLFSPDRKKTSKFKGVSAKTDNPNKWISQINFNGEKIYLGIYDSEIEAAVAYNDASALFHRDFGKPANTFFKEEDWSQYAILVPPLMYTRHNFSRVIDSEGTQYESVLDAAQLLGVKPNTIVKAITDVERTNLRRVKGLTFKYLEKGPEVLIEHKLVRK